MKDKLRRCVLVALIIFGIGMLGLHLSRQLNFSDSAQIFVRNSASNAAIATAPRGRYPVLGDKQPVIDFTGQLKFRKVLRDKSSDYLADSPYVFVIFDRGYRYEIRALTSPQGESTGFWIVGKWYIREWNNITPVEERGGDLVAPMRRYQIGAKEDHEAAEFIANFRSKTLVPDYIGRD